MLDFIFVTGTSGVGKSTLCKNLMDQLRSVVVEEHMVPEFLSRDGVEDMTGELEERTCWECTKAMAQCFHRLGYRNVIISDIDDLRTSDIPIDFRGYRYLTLKLVCTDPEQLQSQMRDRPANGLIDYELQEKCNAKNLMRAPLVNEHTIDVAGLTENDVFTKALEILSSKEPLTEYEYTRPPKEQFYSWVFANGLR
ncbi:MAG: AAA family ATPase [Clostridia bacterium]|nr:AAA family ATPase [Clostridia bacterium]